MYFFSPLVLIMSSFSHVLNANEMLIFLNDLLYLGRAKARGTPLSDCFCAQGMKSNLTKCFPIKVM